MKTMTSLAVAAALAASTVFAATAASAGCVDKGGRGTGTTVPDAKFQAWEAVLQATDWGMWSVWITTNGTVGKAANGYKVSRYREKCSNGGMLGKECIIRARLCK